MPEDAASRRRARRDRRPAVGRDGPAAHDPLMVADQSPPSDYQLLGARPASTKLQIVQGYQRAQRSAQTDKRRRALAAAFRKLGAQPIRSRCPEGHDLALYAIDGDTHSAYCSACYEQSNAVSTYRYIGWATCRNVSSRPGQDMDPRELPYDLPAVAQADVDVRYDTPAGERMLQFTMDAGVRLRLHPGDFFSVIYREQVPWRLLNHTLAESFALDPHQSHRAELEARRKRAQTRNKVGRSAALR